MPARFDKFIHDENVKNFKKHIAAETDPTRLALLATLLKEEQERPMWPAKVALDDRAAKS